MFGREQYELLDFANGEKLERFGGLVVRRQTPSVPVKNAGHRDCDWSSQLRFAAGKHAGKWTGDHPDDWQIQHRSATFLLKPTPAGQVGVFPEQAINWDWIADLPLALEGSRALNLFGYTGGTTMALAARGASVVHLDAARNVVGWARENAAAAGMADLPIRWIVDDAIKFVQREIKRGSNYDILIADPPSYGKGPKNESWKFEEQIENLLAGMAALATSSLSVIILSCHTPGYFENDLASLIQHHFDVQAGFLEAFPLKIKTAQGHALASGHCCRWFRRAHQITEID